MHDIGDTERTFGLCRAYVTVAVVVHIGSSSPVAVTVALTALLGSTVGAYEENLRKGQCHRTD